MGNKTPKNQRLEQERRDRESGKSLSTRPEQIRRRVRRRGHALEIELDRLYKPIEEWDAEELSRGRPKDKNGRFTGVPPEYMKRELHEEIVKRFHDVVRSQMAEQTLDALRIVNALLNDQSEDKRGRPKVSASVKLDAAKFLIEHIVGKPKQHVEQDISIRLQAVLGAAMVIPDPGDMRALAPGIPGFIDADAEEEE